MENISVKLPEPMVSLLNNAARKTGRSRSALVRLALEKFLREERKLQGYSAMDVSRDLAGCVEAPSDLSFNPKHMRGYGK